MKAIINIVEKYQVVQVNTGEVEILQGNGMLRAPGIGSCVVAAVFDPAGRVGAMAHVMLPGKSESSSHRRNRYAVDAMSDLYSKMAAAGVDTSGLKICLVGGGNVLGESHTSPGPAVIQTVYGELMSRGGEIVASELGGLLRRTCSLYIPEGRVMFSEGDSGLRVLWSAVDASGCGDKRCCGDGWEYEYENKKQG